MRNYTDHFKRADRLARDVFGEFQTTERAYNAAKKNMDAHQMTTAKTGRDEIEVMKAREDYIEAEEKYKHALRDLQEKKRAEMDAIREALITAIDSDYVANPEEIDSRVMELLNSGILNSGEYSSLMKSARENDNYTMMRIIGQRAGNAADEIEKKYGKDDNRVAELLRVSNEGKTSPGEEWIESFDTLSGIFNRCIENPAMMDKWGELTEPIIEG